MIPPLGLPPLNTHLHSFSLKRPLSSPTDHPHSAPPTATSSSHDPATPSTKRRKPRVRTDLLTLEEKRALFLGLPGVVAATPTSFDCHCGKTIQLVKRNNGRDVQYDQKTYRAHINHCKGPPGSQAPRSAAPVAGGAVAGVSPWKLPGVNAIVEGTSAEMCRSIEFAGSCMEARGWDGVMTPSTATVVSLPAISLPALQHPYPHPAASASPTTNPSQPAIQPIPRKQVSPEEKELAFLALPGVLSATPVSFECHCGKEIKLIRRKNEKECLYDRSNYWIHMKYCRGPEGGIVNPNGHRRRREMGLQGTGAGGMVGDGYPESPGDSVGEGWRHHRDRSGSWARDPDLYANDNSPENYENRVAAGYRYGGGYGRGEGESDHEDRRLFVSRIVATKQFARMISEADLTPEEEARRSEMEDRQMEEERSWRERRRGDRVVEPVTVVG